MGPRLLVIVSSVALVLIGLVMVYSASSIEAISESGDSLYYAVRQLGFALVGVVLCITLIKFVPYSAWLGKLCWVVWGLAVGLLLLTAAIGHVGLGAQRWLSLGPLGLQPSEFAKIAFLLMSAKIVYEFRNDGLSVKQVFIRFTLLIIVPLAVLYRTQSDLGTTMICFVGILTIMWMGEVPLRAIFTILGAGVVFGVLAGSVGYRADRWAFINPWADYYGTGYQLIHSFFAFAQGGVLGTGLGNSAEKYLYLPEAETDFIFSIIGEELGLIGAVTVIVLFLVFLFGGLRMAQAAPDDFGAMLCGAFAVIIIFQAFLNIGCVIGVCPTTGKPLPFISSGGSSLIASLIMVGIMLSVSYVSDGSSVYRKRREDLRLIKVEEGEMSSTRRPRTSAQSKQGSARVAATLRGGARISTTRDNRLPSSSRSSPRSSGSASGRSSSSSANCSADRASDRAVSRSSSRPSSRGSGGASRSSGRDSSGFSPRSSSTRNRSSRRK